MRLLMLSVIVVLARAAYHREEPDVFAVVKGSCRLPTDAADTQVIVDVGTKKICFYIINAKENEGLKLSGVVKPFEFTYSFLDSAKSNEDHEIVVTKCKNAIMEAMNKASKKKAFVQKVNTVKKTIAENGAAIVIATGKYRSLSVKQMKTLRTLVYLAFGHVGILVRSTSVLPGEQESKWEFESVQFLLNGMVNDKDVVGCLGAGSGSTQFSFGDETRTTDTGAKVALDKITGYHKDTTNIFSKDTFCTTEQVEEWRAYVESQIVSIDDLENGVISLISGFCKFWDYTAMSGDAPWEEMKQHLDGPKGQAGYNRLISFNDLNEKLTTFIQSRYSDNIDGEGQAGYKPATCVLSATTLQEWLKKLPQNWRNEAANRFIFKRTFPNNHKAGFATGYYLAVKRIDTPESLPSVAISEKWYDNKLYIGIGSGAVGALGMLIIVLVIKCLSSDESLEEDIISDGANQDDSSSDNGSKKGKAGKDSPEKDAKQPVVEMNDVADANDAEDQV